MAKYDIAILGAGPGGYVAAIRAAQNGAKVALIERENLGGTCLNWGCIPSKALLESVHVLKFLQKADDFGLSCENVSFDLDKIYERKDKIVEQLRAGIGMLMKKNKVDVIEGFGKLKNAKEIEVEGQDETVEADKIILATGTVPMRPDFFPMDEENIVDSDYFLALTDLPESVLIIGGGVIGCEMATVLSGLGVKVTIVEMLPRLLPLSDEDISKEMRKVFKKSKVGIMLDTKVEKLQVVKDGEVTAKLSGDKELKVEKVLVAIGRTMCTEGIGLENVGIETSKPGIIEVNDNCQTSVPNIYAIGDITGKMQLAHVASKMGLAAAAHATGKKEEHINWNVVPACVFTQPEIGNVGLTEAEAKEQGRDVKSAKFAFRGLGKALAGGEVEGFFKIVADASTGEVLGLHIIGPHAADIIAEGALAMQMECTVAELAHTIHAHPTLYEGVMECAESWLGMGVHG